MKVKSKFFDLFIPLKDKGTLRASVLAAVLVVAVLMLLLTMSLLLLKEQYGASFHTLQYRRQQQMWIDSGFLLYCRGGVPALTDTAGYVLFPSDRRSRIRVKARPWGLYEVLEITAGKDSRSVCLLGMESPGKYAVQLYICDRNGIVSLAGHTIVRGKACLPAGGVNYTSVGSDFFSGPPVSAGQITKSEPELPDLSPEARRQAEACCDRFSGDIEPENGQLLVRSFSDTPLVLYKTGTVEGHYAGPLILCSDGILTIAKECRLDNVVVSAPAVRIESGFRGRLQVFATDTVLVEKEAELLYPSGIFMSRYQPGRWVEIREGAVVNGYVIIDGDGRSGKDGFLHYRQYPGAKVRGLVYVDGVAQVQGCVSGALFLQESYYYSPAGYYTGLLYQLSVLKNEAVAWPYWMAGKEERRVIRWLE